MKMKKKRILGILLSLAMMLTMMPGMTAFAASPGGDNNGAGIDNPVINVTEYNLWVGGTQVTSANASDIFSNGAASYDATSNTLTLKGATISGGGESSNFAAVYSNGINLTINVTGDNSVTGPDNSSGSSRGIYVLVGSLTVEGTGSLTANGGTARDQSCGAYANGDITVEKDATLTAKGVTTTSGGSYGANAYQNITIKGVLNASGGTGKKSYGAFSNSKLEVSGTMTATGGTANDYSYGAYAGNDISMSGTLTATSGEAGNSSYGAYASTKISISGNMTATGGKATYSSYGTYSGKGMTVNGVLTATGGEATNGSSYGSFEGSTYEGNGIITINGKMIAEGGTAKSSYGIRCDDGITVNEKAELTAVGSSSAISGGKVTNAIEGTGWENDSGTGTQKTIPVSDSGQYLSYKKVQFPVAHTHSFTYSASGTTINATCANTDGNCTLPASTEGGTDHVATLTIAEPTLTTYGQTGEGISAEATITDANSLKGDAAVKYYKATKNGTSYTKSGDALSAAPTGAGDYVAEITLGSGTNTATASVGYTIAKASPGTPTVTMSAYTYEGTVSTPAIGTYNGEGEVAYYYNTTNSTTGGTEWKDITNTSLNAGTYYMYAVIAATDNYASYTTATTSFTIAKTDQTAPAAPTKSAATVNSITLTATKGYEYKCGDGNWQTSPSFTGLTMNTAYTFYQRKASDDNHNASAPSNGASISTNNHAHEWSYAADGAVLTATCANTDGGHGTTLTATLTINAPTLTTYGETGKSADATITGSIDGVTNPNIVYKEGSNTLDAAPTDAGIYTASITLGEGNNTATANVQYNITPATISSVAVNGIDKPEASSALDTVATTSTEHVKLSNSGEITWDPAAPQDGKAAYATTYKATVTAIADKNYVFADSATATVNEQTATVTKNHEGTLSISYIFDKTDLTPVTITANNKEVMYSADGIVIPVEGMFTIPEGAGEATYAVENETGEGTWSAQTGKLTVTKCGTFNVKVSTAATETHAAGAETSAMLTVNKANAVATTVNANNRIYDGTEKPLITVDNSTLEGGEMQYALGDDAETTPTSDWSASIPTATNTGTYYVWYKVIGDANHNDVDSACITVTISAPAPTPDPEPAEKEEEIVVPVSGDESEQTVQVSAYITTDESGTTSAKVAEVTTEEIDNVAEENGTVTIDLTAITTKSGEDTNVTSVTVSAKTVESVIESKASSLEIKLDSAAAVIDEATLETLVEAAKESGGDTITLVIDKDEKAEASLSDEQKAVVREMGDSVVLDAYFVSGGERISDFKGGTVQLTAAYETEKPVTVLYIDSNGNVEKIESTYDAEKKVTTFKVKHFSNYVITETKANTLTVKAKKKAAAVKYSRLKKKARTIKLSRLLKVSKAIGTVTYSKVSVKKGGKSYRRYFTVNSKTGKVTIKKGLKKGTYTIAIKVKAAGENEYAAAEKTVKVKIKVK